MRRLTIALLLAAGAIALPPRRLLVWLGLPKATTGIFPDRMAYTRWGSGSKTLLFMPGGPGILGDARMRGIARGTKAG